MVASSQVNLADWTQKAKDYVDSKQHLLLPGVCQDVPWSQESLVACEKWFLADAKTIPARRRIEYEIFLGEGLRRRFSGQWAHASILDKKISHEHNLLGIYYPQLEQVDVTGSLLTNALATKTGDFWASVFQLNESLRLAGLVNWHAPGFVPSE